jgi:hypothetical protein
MFKRTHIAFALAAVALAAPAGLSAANNPAASGNLSSQADFVTTSTITAYVTAQCAPYSQYNGTPGVGYAYVSVNEAAGGSTVGGQGFGQTQFTCDGQSHKLAISVSPGPWQLGTALASWSVCGFTCDSGTKQIKIS